MEEEYQILPLTAVQPFDGYYLQEVAPRPLGNWQRLDFGRTSMHYTESSVLRDVDRSDYNRFELVLKMC